MKLQENLIKRGKYGLIFWFISCLMGSIIVVEIERHLLNQMKGFNMPITEGIELWVFITLIILIASSPVIMLIYSMSKKTKQLGRLITLTLLLSFIMAYFITLELSRSYFEAFYITSPYFAFAFTFEIFYLKIEHQSTSPAGKLKKSS